MVGIPLANKHRKDIMLLFTEKSLGGARAQQQKSAFVILSMFVWKGSQQFQLQQILPDRYRFPVKSVHFLIWMEGKEDQSKGHKCIINKLCIGSYLKQVPDPLESGKGSVPVSAAETRIGLRHSWLSGLFTGRFILCSLLL